MTLSSPHMVGMRTDLKGRPTWQIRATAAVMKANNSRHQGKSFSDTLPLFSQTCRKYISTVSVFTTTKFSRKTNEKYGVAGT